MEHVRKGQIMLLLVALYWDGNFVGRAVGLSAITTVCPDNFTHGANNTVKCYIDTAAVSSAACETPPNTVVFGLLRSAGEFDSLCRVDYPGTCTSSPDVRCGCVSSSGGTNTYQVTFDADESQHRGGSLSCTVNCGAVPALSTNVTGGCQSITVVTTTVTDEITASTEKVTTTVTTTTTTRTDNGTITTMEITTTTTTSSTTVLPEP